MCPTRQDWVLFLLLCLFAALMLMCGGCATQPTQHGIPNFGVVSAKDAIYRGGQPTSEGWTWLLTQAGATNDIKLNTRQEASDDGGQAQGMSVKRFPITTAQQFFGNGLNDTIPKAVAAITPGSLIHCSHGKNRTGTVVAVYRLTHDGWSTKAARAEMTRYGWGDSLPGLRWYFSCVATQP